MVFFNVLHVSNTTRISVECKILLLLEKTPKKHDWADGFWQQFQFAFFKSYPKQKYNLFILCILANLFTIEIVSFCQFQ